MCYLSFRELYIERIYVENNILIRPKQFQFKRIDLNVNVQKKQILHYQLFQFQCFAQGCSRYDIVLAKQRS